MLHRVFIIFKQPWTMVPLYICTRKEMCTAKKNEQRSGCKNNLLHNNIC